MPESARHGRPASRRAEALRITHRKAEDVPAPRRNRNALLAEIMRELKRLAPGMVMVIETGDEATVRGTKVLITQAGRELGIPVRHWHAGSEVYARPVAFGPVRKTRVERANRADFRD